MSSSPPLLSRRALAGGAALVVFCGASATLAFADAKQPEKTPLIEVNRAGLQLAIPIKAPTPLISDQGFEQALAGTPVAEDNRQRMAAALAGEKATYAALKLHGQERIDALEKAARGGEAAAAEALGDMLDTGDGVKMDPERAGGYYRAAALGGRMAAAHSLAVAYAKGRGVRRDFTEALAWMIVARQRGDESGVEEQLRAYLKRHEADAAIPVAEKLARELAVKASPGQIAAALPAVAPLEFDEARAEPEDDDADTEAAPPAAAAEAAPDAPPGPPPLVVMTIFGERLSWPTREALERAANRGEPAALTALGRLLTNGKLPPDPLRAVLVLEEAAAKGEIDAAHQLGELYAKGEGLVHDDAKAFGYYMQAAKGGSPVAMASVGVCYTNGRGIARNLPRGLAWLTLAKEFGADLGQESRLRAFLTQYRPADVAAADQLTKLLRDEIVLKGR